MLMPMEVTVSSQHIGPRLAYKCRARAWMVSERLTWCRVHHEQAVPGSQAVLNDTVWSFHHSLGRSVEVVKCLLEDSVRALVICSAHVRSVM